MSNWKNRTMMMNSGGSVSRPTMTDFFEQGYADLGSEESPSTYYNDNRRSDRNIDDLRRLMQNQYYDKISSGTSIGDIKEQVNKIQNMKRKGRNLKQDLDYGPFSGSLSANGNSISARANVGKGILELLKDKESGNNSASYRRGNYSLSGSESGRKSLDYEDGIFYGSAFTGDKRLGDGVKAGMRFRFSKGGPVQGFANGGTALDMFKDAPGPFKNIEDRFGEGQFILPKGYEGSDDGGVLSALTRFPYSNLPLGPEQGDFYTEGPYTGRKKSSLRRRMEDPRRMSNRKKSLPGYQLHEAAVQLQKTKKRLKEIQFSLDNESFTLNPKRKKRLEDMRDKFSNYVQTGTENLSLLAQPLVTEMDNVKSLSPEGIEAMRNSTIAEDGLVTDPATLLEIQAPDISIGSNSEEITKNINDATDISEVIKSIDGIEQGPVTSKEPSNEKEEEEELRKYLNDIADEQTIKDTGSYSPEAQRAGQVAAMYGQVAPGQIGGMGASLARGAFAAENKQQELDKTKAAYEEALAVQASKNAAAKAGTTDYNKPQSSKFATLAGEDVNFNVYYAKDPLGNLKPILADKGQVVAFISDVSSILESSKAKLKKLETLSELVNKNGIFGAAGKLTNAVKGLFNIKDNKSYDSVEATALIDQLSLEIARDLLNEGGKMISNEERERVDTALGKPGLFKSQADVNNRVRIIRDLINKADRDVTQSLRDVRKAFPNIANEEMALRNKQKIKVADLPG